RKCHTSSSNIGSLSLISTGTNVASADIQLIDRKERDNSTLEMVNLLFRTSPISRMPRSK
ncbi:MAG: hypothetical protein LRZ88_03945, partial [Candidatus Cloacimonetes bacterium]|nr:hypothetical protein [Candidatus Cloacimonadota bacterium]